MVKVPQIFKKFWGLFFPIILTNIRVVFFQGWFKLIFFSSSMHECSRY